MRIPFLILCLVVVYGTCQIDGARNIDETKEILYNKDYKENYADVSSEKFLTRHKRDNLLSLILPFLGNNTDISKIIYTLLLNMCEKNNVNPFSTNSFTNIGTTILCPIFKKIKPESIQEGINCVLPLVKKTLPTVHTMLDMSDKCGILNFFPQNFRDMIKTFNQFYPLIRTFLGIKENKI